MNFSFANKERWYYFDYTDYSQRGFRFYKIKVSRNINREIFFKLYLPMLLAILQRD